MLHNLTQKTISNKVSLEISDDHKLLGVFKEDIKIAEFDIALVWNMIRDNLATIDVGFIARPELFRRKGEAAAAILYTNKMYFEKE